ncbi:hypothetical protein MnTg03_01164 [bacterium MnTg03]|nr:hypothetical protein MnTg03_01164 [bacterium MnTg03]
MKLDKLHVGDPTTSAPCHRNTITSRSVWITRIEIDLAGAASGQYDFLRRKNIDMLIVLIERVKSPTLFGFAYQVDGDMLVEYFNIAVFVHMR